ncbi:GNAT family N-acetyltransferase [Bradyrhizobium sp.]|uniref:GNAT family N-acetyltransferase n=1 Tax=Bradyrhizobium sp. TaxID=376 RepID=UPI001D382368|nr:GNAT family N-acetyltransferase [Bradyrhizobium sp.]MBV8701400.1 GNAT family N-acetyltransferase [Bradyrhizobium sp.]MBV8923120.1 GNAT family N-acetyltransferase [Bradyrhizobium sp.]
MNALRLDDLGHYSDILYTRRGDRLALRFVEPADAEALQHYVRGLSSASRYNRFFGALGELPKALLDRFTHISPADGFTVIGAMAIDGLETIVGEARYIFHADSQSVEFGISVADRWHGHGIGPALLKNLECRAAAFGAKSLIGDTLRSNGRMIAVARKAGFELTRHPHDWKLVRITKPLAVEAEDVPCASWRIAAASRAQTARLVS